MRLQPDVSVEAEKVLTPQDLVVLKQRDGVFIARLLLERIEAAMLRAFRGPTAAVVQ
jgi:hypothetical protein